jgi:hypothetical protein
MYKKPIGQINVQSWQRSEGNTRSNNGLSIQLHTDSDNIYKYLRIPLCWALETYFYNHNYLETEIGGL